MTWPYRFCPDCGAPLEPAGSAGQPCARCGAVQYRNAKPCAGVLLTRDDGSLLLARRAVEPRRGAWDIVGGFVHADELPADAALREAKEETGLDVKLGQLVGMFVDQYGAEPGSDYTLNIYYLAELTSNAQPVPTSDVSELRWFAADELPPVMAFPHERLVLDAWRETQAGRVGQRGSPA